MNHLTPSRGLVQTLVGAACMAACLASHAAVISISSRDAPGVGFNDPTPVAPVGGNTGTTLGQQRLNVYRFVADIWEQNLQSDVPVTVSAGWEALTCTAGSAVLGSAGAWNVWRDFANAPKTGTWYPQALANKLAGVNLSAGVPDDGSGFGNVDIKTQFNVNLGTANCLAGSPFYLGLDGNPPGTQVNLVATLLHELGHGLGFSVLTTNTATGVRFQGLPSIWEGFMLDNSTGKLWLQMTDAERVASTINFRQLGWTGANAVAGTPLVLDPGVTPVPKLTIGGPAAGASAGDKIYATAGFGPQLSVVPVVGDLMPVVAQTAAAGQPPGPGCGPLTALDAKAVRGNIALIDRGVCGFAVKVKNAQLAGAKAVIIANTAAGAFGPLGGADATITIPALMVTFADANLLKTALANRSRTSSGVLVTMAALPTGGQFVGTDPLSRPLLYTPNPRIAGSSVSHWDTSATPSLLMEPNITPGLTTILTTPKDLTVPLLKDLGW